ncbi:MAG: TadE/TadG family type IV pilus assembly protein [Candidatus Dormibacteria bacterium]
MVEFALVLPVFLAIILVLGNVGWLFFQYAAITDAARTGARAAAIESPLVTGTCESNTPQSIESAVQQAASIVPVSNVQLCSSGSTTTLVQAGAAGNAAAIAVTATPLLATPTQVTVTVTYTTHALIPIFIPAITLTATSTLAVQG